MDFLVCRCGLVGLEVHITLENIKHEDEAVSKAKEIALQTKEGFTVGLFTQDGKAICGWRVLKDKKLQNENTQVIHNSCCVGSASFDLAKGQAERRQKSNANKGRKQEHL